MAFNPDITVAAVVERDRRFLLVEEHAQGKLVFNQPAGHLDDRESLLHAVTRETLEETAWDFTPRELVGIYHWRSDGGMTFLRFCFSGDLGIHHPTRPLDEPIVAAHWLTREQILAREAQLRSPMVLRCIDDYLAGVRVPLHAIRDLLDDPLAAARAGENSAG